MARFLPGFSGNPGGRPRGHGDAARVAREHVAHAVFGLARLCCDVSAPHQVQLHAARELLARGFGRVVVGGEASGSPGGGVGRFPALRTRLEGLLQDLEDEHGRFRRLILLELEQLEREEGLTVAPEPSYSVLGLWDDVPPG